jgi:hypothetical protein
MSVANILDFGGTGKILPRYIPPFPQTVAYGSFSSTTTQYVTGVNQATPLTYNTTEIAQYTNISGSRVYVQQTGVYRVSYSVQLDIDDNKNGTTDLFISVNGTPVPRSTTKNVLQGKDAEYAPYCDYILSLNAGQYYEVVLVGNNATIHAAYFAGNGTYPVIPSIITNVQQIA